MLIVMAVYSGFLLQPVQLNSRQDSAIARNSIQNADTLRRATKLHKSNPNHRLNHPGNASTNNSASFHNPSRSLNFHSDGIRRSGSALHTSSCILSSQTAHGLEAICFYNCHGHRRSIQLRSTDVCPHSMPESAF